MSIFDDLVAEQDRLQAVLAELDDGAWRSPSGAAGWTVSDVVLHLAQTEEAVAASAVSAATSSTEGTWRAAGESVDAAAERMVQAERADPAAVFDRWRRARRAAVAALRAAGPDQRLPWVTGTLKPSTLATTRLAEHWAHGLDVTMPFDIPFPDTDRLVHIAWLGHATLPYAFTLAGEEPHDVFCELTAPSGAVWRYGPSDADSTIRGSAGAFCRVGAHRLAPEESGLSVSGPYGAAALRVLRNYAD